MDIIQSVLSFSLQIACHDDARPDHGVGTARQNLPAEQGVIFDEKAGEIVG